MKISTIASKLLFLAFVSSAMADHYFKQESGSWSETADTTGWDCGAWGESSADTYDQAVSMGKFFCGANNDIDHFKVRKVLATGGTKVWGVTIIPKSWDYPYRCCDGPDRRRLVSAEEIASAGKQQASGLRGNVIGQEGQN